MLTPLALTSVQSAPNMAALSRSTLDRPNHGLLSALKSLPELAGASRCPEGASGVFEQ